jgi:Icc-related predicted phosphoesterase
MPLQLQVVSDLHLDHHRDGGLDFLTHLPVAAEVLVIAGDLAELRFFGQTKERLESLCKGRRRVFFVTGNHEYYNGTPSAVDALIAAVEAELPVLRVLRPGRVEELDGHRVLGATLWFRDDPYNAMYAKNMNDFHQIKQFTPWVYEQNVAALNFLESDLSPGDIVVTHHLPSKESVHPRYTGSPINRFFLCDMEGLIRERKPALWLHGHTHQACDYKIDTCRIVANPLGYPRESSNLTFNDKLVLSVP